MSDMLLEWLQPALTSVAVLLVALTFRLVRRAPKVLRTLVDELKRQAANTPTPADDAAAAFLSAMVDAFDKALSGELDKPRK